MNLIINNVEMLLNKYGAAINTVKKLILIYWQQIDGVQMDKLHINTSSYIQKATLGNQILDAKMLLELRKGIEEERRKNFEN